MPGSTMSLTMFEVFFLRFSRKSVRLASPLVLVVLVDLVKAKKCNRLKWNFLSLKYNT